MGYMVVISRYMVSRVLTKYQVSRVGLNGSNDTVVQGMEYIVSHYLKTV